LQSVITAAAVFTVSTAAVSTTSAVITAAAVYVTAAAFTVVVVTDLFGSVRERVKAFTRIECKFCIGGGRSFDQLTVRW
jgi:hypothetical protein